MPSSAMLPSSVMRTSSGMQTFLHQRTMLPPGHRSSPGLRHGLPASRFRPHQMRLPALPPRQRRSQCLRTLSRNLPQCSPVSGSPRAALLPRSPRQISCPEAPDQTPRSLPREARTSNRRRPPGPCVRCGAEGSPARQCP